MPLLHQIFLIFGLSFLGELISKLLPFPLPGSIIGMLLLILLLFTGKVKEDHIKEKTQFLFAYMPIIFLPAAVKLLNYLDILSAIWWQFLLICFVSTFLTFVVTSVVAKVLVKIFVPQSKGSEGAVQ